MKALIYLLFLPVTLPLMSQRMPETLVELSKPGYSQKINVNPVQIIHCCCCVAYRINENKNQLTGTTIDMEAYRNFGAFIPQWESNIIITSVRVRPDIPVIIEEEAIETPENIYVILGGIPGQYTDIPDSSEYEHQKIFLKQLNANTQKSTIKGTVIDKDDNPAFANVIIYGDHLKGEFKGTQTDESGSFLIQAPPGNYTLKITQQGHIEYTENIIVQAEKNLNVGTIRLKEPSIDLLEHVVHTHFTMDPRVQIIEVPQMDIIKSFPIKKTGSEINSEQFTNELQVIDLDIIVPNPNDINENEKSTQGPFTGLEGHNFTEKPAIIYPNPVQDILHVKSTDPITVIEILNIHGETLRTFYINETMDVSELAAGTYFARIHFENINDIQIEQVLIVK